MTKPARARSEFAPVPGQPAVPTNRPTPTIETLTNSPDHGVVVLRDRAINLRDNLVRVANGERLERSRALVTQAVAVALGKD